MERNQLTAELLLAARQGDRDAYDRLFAQLYDHLREIAHHRLMRAPAGETLNTTALVHEAYLRLSENERIDVRDRAHFFALASRVMRCVLVDHARARSARKRDAGAVAVPLERVEIAADERAADLLTLNDALERLMGYSERLGTLVEYRFFGGLSYEEIADITGWSIPTVKRDWTRARAWLHRTMHDDD